MKPWPKKARVCLPWCTTGSYSYLAEALPLTLHHHQPGDLTIKFPWASWEPWPTIWELLTHAMLRNKRVPLKALPWKWTPLINSSWLQQMFLFIRQLDPHVPTLVPTHPPFKTSSKCHYTSKTSETCHMIWGTNCKASQPGKGLKWWSIKEEVKRGRTWKHKEDTVEFCGFEHTVPGVLKYQMDAD